VPSGRSAAALKTPGKWSWLPTVRDQGVCACHFEANRVHIDGNPGPKGTPMFNAKALSRTALALSCRLQAPPSSSSTSASARQPPPVRAAVASAMRHRGSPQKRIEAAMRVATDHQLLAIEAEKRLAAAKAKVASLQKELSNSQKKGTAGRPIAPPPTSMKAPLEDTPTPATVGPPTEERRRSKRQKWVLLCLRRSSGDKKLQKALATSQSPPRILNRHPLRGRCSRPPPAVIHLQVKKTRAGVLSQTPPQNSPPPIRVSLADKLGRGESRFGACKILKKSVGSERQRRWT
jgi:hypothetical protein